MTKTDIPVLENYANEVLDNASHTVGSWPGYMQRPEARGITFTGCRDRGEGPCCLSAGHAGYCVATLPIPEGHPIQRSVSGLLAEALMPFVEREPKPDDPCHFGTTTMENCGHCRTVLAGRAALRAAGRLP